MRLSANYSREHKRRELEIGEGPVLCTVSGLKDFRDHDTLIRSLPRLLADHPTLSTLIVGDGPREPYLRELAAELGLEERVHFLGDRFDAVEILAAADLFCQPTFIEGLPLSVLDAMSLGIPVVASDVAGVREIVEDGRTGLLVPTKDVPAHHLALDQLLEDPDLAGRIAAAASDWVEKRFPADRWIRQIQDLYVALADPESRPASARGPLPS
jgi:L-malate glycosyltransferase